MLFVLLFLFIYFLFFKTKEGNVLFNDALNIDHSDIGFNLCVCVWGGGVMLLFLFSFFFVPLCYFVVSLFVCRVLYTLS